MKPIQRIAVIAVVRDLGTSVRFASVSRLSSRRASTIQATARAMPMKGRKAALNAAAKSSRNAARSRDWKSRTMTRIKVR